MGGHKEGLQLFNGSGHEGATVGRAVWAWAAATTSILCLCFFDKKIELQEIP